ncbi:putative DNA binding protein 10 [Elsinoe australis]|uniref:Putative DNA binding protein 10 n=1 Tax=Elsinoe australis TaxID=40998 RepID=A0A4U7AZ01_9PEZI|nr:putative DNA binding protein 10 [Elsinoe australis]
MPLFSRLSNALWEYVSPVKPAAETKRKQTTISSKQSSLYTLQHRRSMSPRSRVKSWHIFSPTTSADHTSHTSCTSPSVAIGSKRKRTPSIAEEAPAKRGRGRPSKLKASPQLIIKRPRGRPRKTRTPARKNMDIDMDADYEGSTLLEDDISSLMSEIHVAAPNHNKTTPRAPLSWTSHDAADDTLHDLAPTTPNPPFSAPGPTAVSPALTTTGATPTAQLPTRDLSAFPLSIQPLIQHLLLRGREPLFPATWRNDFRFLPSSLFFPSPAQQAVVGSLNGSEFRAQKSFEELLGLGARVRDKVLVGKRPEGLAVKAVEKYTSWAGRDAGLVSEEKGGCPGMLVVTSGTKEVDVSLLQRDLAGRMEEREREWRAWLGGRGEVPCLYGVVVSHTMVAFVGYEPGEERTVGREEKLQAIMQGMSTIGMFDSGVKGLDVWNALAVALLVVHVRDVMRGYAA